MAREPYLTKRDLQVILDVHRFRYLTTWQIEQMRFPSRRTANRRLKYLIDEGYLREQLAPGVDDRLFYLGSKGVEVVAGATEVAAEIPRVSHPAKDYYFLRHFVQLNDFRIALEKTVETRDDLTLLGFIPEYVGEKTAGGGVKKTIRETVKDVRDPRRALHHTPDAVFGLQKGDRSALYFLEIDRGTETLSDREKGFLKAVWFYYCSYVGETYQRYAEVFQCESFPSFRVLFVVPSEERIENMRRAVSALNMKESRFVWLAPREMIRTGTVFEPRWRSAEEHDPNSYRIG